MEARILALADEKMVKPKKGGLKLINDSDVAEPGYLQKTQTINAKVLLDHKSGMDTQLVQ